MKISQQFRSASFILAFSHIGSNAARIGASRQERKNDNNEGRDLAAEKEYVRDETSSIIMSKIRTNEERMETSCGPNERVFDIRVKTDGYGYENKFTLRNANGLVASEPSSNSNFADNSDYDFSYCVTAGQQYTLKMTDLYNDGMCCEFGNGFYKFGVDGDMSEKFTEAGTHSFVVPAIASSSSSSSGGGNGGGGSGSGSSSGNSGSSSSSSTGSGSTSVEAFDDRSSDSDGCIKVEIQPDNHGEETSWTIKTNSGSIVASAERGTYTGVTNAVTRNVCLSSGTYKFQVQDQYGDGMCCGSGKGHFAVSLDGSEILRGGNFQQNSDTYTIKIGFRPSMSERDEKYLVAHNTRRMTYHRKYGKSYVPLKWSPDLASQARTWASKLLSTCSDTGISHEHEVVEGENLAKNVGSDGYMGQLYEPDLILKRWVDNEEFWGWPRNAHMTQVLWRATKYVGCGESEKPFNGGTCRIQVCRYARAGNCAMGSYDASSGDNWKVPMLEDVTRCGPDCPPEGCF